MAVKRLTCTAFKCIFVIYVLCCSLLFHTTIGVQDGDKEILQDSTEPFLPTVLIATLIRNKAHTLPWFFGQLEKLNYPKDRIALWIRSDHNIDNSSAIIQEWINATENLYNSVDFEVDDASEGGYPNEKGPCDWTEQRFSHVMHLREEALNAARVMWADYLFMVDADVMIENPDTLKILVEQEKSIVAPMMNVSVGTYSNFWGGMDEMGYYRRVPEYFVIVERRKLGVFQVPMVHTVLLICMKCKSSEKLSYLPQENYKKAMDDIIVFAVNAMELGVPLHVVNAHFFGHLMVPLDDYHTLDIDKEQFLTTRMDIQDFNNPEMGPGVDYIVEGRGLTNSPHIYLPPFKPKNTLGFDQVYMINLERRPERRTRMLHMFDLLAIDALYVAAVDGNEISSQYIQELGIDILPGFVDPYKGRQLNDTYLYTDLNIHVVAGFTDPYFGRKLNNTYLFKDLKLQVVPGFTDPHGGRPMTMGEIGCFLSHYFIWKDVVEKNYRSVVVFEDDLKFEPYFRTKLANIMRHVERKVPQWDLIYLGRKRLNRQDEYFIDDVENLVWPSYSYWTLSYLLTRRGAEKLLAQNPLQNLLPVDEYLPVMFDKHPQQSWKEPFEPRDLVALSAEPLLIYPTHYLGEPHYISDTEYSELITETESDSSHNMPEEPQGPPLSTSAGPGLPGEQWEGKKNPHGEGREEL